MTKPMQVKQVFHPMSDGEQDVVQPKALLSPLQLVIITRWALSGDRGP